MRSDQYLITLSVDGQPLGVWDSLTGGDVAAEEIKYRPGGMSPQRALTGPVTVSNVVVGKEYRPDKGDDVMKKFLMARAGRGQAVANRQPLDPDGNPLGLPDIYTGILLMFAPGNVDSNASNVDMMTCTISTEGSVA